MPNENVEAHITLHAVSDNDEHKSMEFRGPDATDIIVITIAGMSCRVRGIDLREAVRRLT